MSEQPVPQCHLTRQRKGWTLIHQGQPLTADGRSLADCLAVAARHKLHLSDRVWIAEQGRFAAMKEAKIAE